MLRDLLIQIRNRIPPQYRPVVQDAFLMLRAIPYIGSRKTCPCCGWKLRSFVRMKGGVAVGYNNGCPRCHSFARHRWMWYFIEQHTDLLQPTPKALLHFAPEFCLARRFRNMEYLHYVGTELGISPRNHLRMDITKMSFAATFHAIICSHVLEHVPDDQAAMRELFRVLKPGGLLLLSIPVRMDQVTYEDFSITTPEGRVQAFGQSDHVRWYGYDVIDRLEEAGFTVQIERSKQLKPAFIQSYGLPANDVLFVCRKSQ